MERLEDALDSIEADYMFFTGDLYDTVDFKNKDYLLKWVERIAKRRPLIIINGNHDLLQKVKGGWRPFFSKPFWDDLHFIRNVYAHFAEEDFRFEDENISVCGINLPVEYYENKERTEKLDMFVDALKTGTTSVEKSEEKPKILLVHSPLYVTNKAALEHISKFNIVLCGHMHNGLVPNFMNRVIPGNRGFVGPLSKILPQNARGDIEIKNGSKVTFLSISGGITKLAESSGLSILSPLYPMEIDNLNYEKGKTKVNRLYFR